MDKRDQIAPCGLDCFNCEIFSQNITDQLREMMARHRGISPEDAACDGCRVMMAKDKPFLNCATYKCAKKKGVEFCFQCNEFPCSNLMPARDGADRYPHNFKLYNLSRMKLIGIDKWIDESMNIRKRYFKGKFVIGTGPVLED